MSRLLAGLLLALSLTPTSARANAEGDLRGAFEGAVVAALADPAAQVSVRRVMCSRPDLLKRARGIGQFDFQPTQRPFGRLSARAELDLGRGKMEPVLVMADVEVMAPVWVAISPIEAGGGLDGAVATELRSLATLPYGPLRGSTAIDTLVAARALPAGTVLTSSTTVRPMLVRRGDVVGVTVRVGEVQVRARGEALRDGRLGETISVKAESGTVFSGEVVDRGRVEVLR